MIRFAEFDLNPEVLASTVYLNYPHRTTRSGIVIGQDVRDEVGEFLGQFIASMAAPDGLFFRIDVFIQTHGLQIIEVNVELQDGWGVGLNLLRAAGQPLEIPVGTRMPGQFVDHGDGHTKEFVLACYELKRLGRNCTIVNKSRSFGHGLPPLEPKRSFPRKSEWDSKIYLARFSDKWLGKRVGIPAMYCHETTPWEAVPDNVVFKFCHKHGPEAERAKYSVIPRDRAGKAKFIRRCYLDGSLVAQQRIEPACLPDGRAVQAVILCSGTNAVTGYLQVADRETFIINDRTASCGPLVWE